MLIGSKGTCALIDIGTPSALTGDVFFSFHHQRPGLDRMFSSTQAMEQPISYLFGAHLASHSLLPHIIAASDITQL
jgi:hypothetical protein